MSDQLWLFNPTTLEVTSTSTSSPESPAGLSPQDSQAGPTTDPCLPGPRLASRSRSRAKASLTWTRGIYGPTCIESLADSGPLLSWESRLRDRLATSGSTEFSLTWRRKVTPGGRSISRLAASTRPISETASTGWPSPHANASTGCGRLPPGGHNLQTAATMSGWTTPQAHDASPPDPTRWRRYGTEHGAANLNDEAAMVMAPWQTPGTDSFRSRGGDRKDEMGLDQQAHYLSGWATPAERDHRFPNLKTYQERGGGKKGEQLPNQVADLAPWATPTSSTPATASYNEAGNSAGLVSIRKSILDSGTSGPSSDPTQKGSTEGLGSLDAHFVAWLMSVPEAVMDCAPSTSCRKGRSKE